MERISEIETRKRRLADAARRNQWAAERGLRFSERACCLHWIALRPV
jgi:hypothetical protein